MAIESQPRTGPIPIGVARRRRRRHALGALLVVGLLVVLTGAVARYVALPRYRPGLQAGEQYGVDVSNHQGDVRWAEVAADGISFAYLKATEGDDFKDRRFRQNWAGAASAGLARGAYHFFTLCSPGAGQAENFLASLPADPQALPPAVDLEFSGCPQRPDVASFRRELGEFVSLVEARTGQEVLIYAMPNFLEQYPLPAGLERDSWVRNLFRRPTDEGWTVWQASNRARVAGVDGPVDLDLRPAS